MSYQRFYKWGSRNKTNIQRLIDGTDFPESDINMADGVFNTTHEMGLAWADNTSGAGVFASGDMSILLPDTAEPTPFGQVWVQANPSYASGMTNDTKTLTLGQQTVGCFDYFCGVSFNSLPSTGDYWAIQHTGVTPIKWNNTAGDTLGNLVTGLIVSTSPPNDGIASNGGTSGSGTFGQIVNNSFSGTGYVEILINGVETF
jgi:hypothetical protein